MSAADTAAAALLTELARRGIELQARGDRLRYRPRSALTPELAERVRVQKPELLTLLRHGPVPEPAQGGQSRPTANATGQGGTIRTDAPAGENRAHAPHELSLVERVESGYVNPGWTAQAWSDRLCQLADRCEALRPELAATYRTWAANVQKNEKNMRSAY